MNTDTLLFGAAYYPEYLTCDRMDQDLSLMRQAGMNLIRVAESAWSTWEPRDGEFDFSLLLRLLDKAHSYGIRVIVGTPTYAIPPWLAAKYPDILADTHNGPSRYGHRQNMDITHPGYLFHCQRIIEKLLEAVANHPAVIGYQLDNETKPYDTCGPRVQAMFREHLKKKFGTVEAMNQAYGFAYWSNSVTTFEELPDVRGTINGSYGAEFAAFQRDLVTKFLLWQRQLVDAHRRPDQFVTHNFDYAWRDYSFGLQPDANQFDAAAAVDVAGIDLYHPGGAELTGAELSFGGDLGRALKRDNFLVLETQAQGPTGRLSYPGQLSLQALHHLAGGANGIEYWHWHSIHNSFESYWKGVLSHDMTPGRVYREAAELGKILARLSPKLQNLKKRNRVAIVVSNRSLTGMDWFPTSGWQHLPGRDYNDYLRWIYDSLYRLNVETDLISDSNLDYASYDAVIFPCTYSASEDMIQAIRSYVENGGNVVATFRSFFADENLKIRQAPQPYGLTDVFGMTYDEFTHPQDVKVGPLAMPVTDWMELLRPQEAKSVGNYHSPQWGEYAAVTWNTFGRGQAAYIGCCFDDHSLDLLFLDLLSRFGIAIPDARWPVVYKTGVNEAGHTLHYFLNYSASPNTLPVPEGTELLTGQVTGSSWTLAPWGTAIIET